MACFIPIFRVTFSVNLYKLFTNHSFSCVSEQIPAAVLTIDHVSIPVHILHSQILFAFQASGLIK